MRGSSAFGSEKDNPRMVATHLIFIEQSKFDTRVGMR